MALVQLETGSAGAREVHAGMASWSLGMMNEEGMWDRKKMN